MASYELPGRQVSEEFSASRSAMAQQNTIGKGGNLDNPVAAASSVNIADYTFLVGTKSDGEGITQAQNGFCATMLVEDEYKAEILALGPWPTLGQVRATISQGGLKLIKGEHFSLQLGGQWAHRAKHSVSPLTTVHVVKGGSLSATDILCLDLPGAWRIGGDCYPPHHCLSTLVTSNLETSSFPSMVISSVLLLAVMLYGFRFLSDLSLNCSDWNALTFVIPYSNDMHGTCLWTGLRQYLPIGTLIHMGVYPWTTSLQRVDTKILPDVLPFWFARFPGNKLGHLDTKPFPRSRFGISLSLLRQLHWGALPLESTHSIKESFLSSPVPALGGVRFTYSQAPTETKSDKITSYWHPGIFSKVITDRPLRFEVSDDNRHIRVLRSSEYERHLPQRFHVESLPSVFSEDYRAIRWFRYSRTNDSHRVDANYTSKSWISPPSTRQPSPEFEDLRALFDGSATPASLKLAQDRVAGIRFLGSRGDRIIQGWQADNIPRGIRFGAFARQAVKNVDYREPAIRLWSRLFINEEFRELNGMNGSSHPPPFENLRLEATGTGANANITFIHAGIPAGANPINPEDPMWTSDAQAGLRAGTKQFIDARDLSREELIEFLSVLDPMISNNQLLAGTGPEDHRVYYAHPLGRYIYGNRTDEIFVHTGFDQMYNAQEQQQIRDAVHGPPNQGAIYTLLRLLSVRHGVGSQLEFALEWAITRNSLWWSNELPSKRPNVTSNMYVCSDGNYDLHMPFTYTASAYLDTFLTPELIPDNVALAMDLKSCEIVNHSTIVGLFRAVALNWAAYALTMHGRMWFNRPSVEGDSRIAVYISVLARTFNFDKITDWSTVHANALALQYGYSVSPSVRATEAGFLRPLHAEWLTPYFVNHYLELWGMVFMPTFQVLPYFDPEGRSSHVGWPSTLPNPIPARESFRNRVRLSRDTPVFSRELWKADGGFMRNAQFYAASGRGGGYRYTGHNNPLELMRWYGDRVDDLPTAPAAMQPTWMSPLNTNFSDFLLPGSIIGFSFSRNRAYTFGIRACEDVDNITSDRWYRAAKQEAFTSVMVNYIHPTRDRRQLDVMLDYSSIILEKGGQYTGMVIIPHVLPEFEVDTDKFNPERPDLRDVTPTPPPTAPPVVLEKPPGDSRVAKRSVTPGARLARAKPRREPAPEASITYEPNNPEFVQDLPALNPYTAEVSPNGIQLVEGAPNGAHPSHPEFHDVVMPDAVSEWDAALERKRTIELDNDYQAFLADQAVKQARFRQEQGERQQARLANAQGHARPGRVRFHAQPYHKPSTARPQGLTTQAPVYGRFPVVPVEPVIPNDAEAGRTQGSLLDMPQSPWPQLSQPKGKKVRFSRTDISQPPTLDDETLTKVRNARTALEQAIADDTRRHSSPTIPEEPSYTGPRQDLESALKASSLTPPPRPASAPPSTPAQSLAAGAQKRSDMIESSTVASDPNYVTSPPAEN